MVGVGEWLVRGQTIHWQSVLINIKTKMRSLASLSALFAVAAFLGSSATSAADSTSLSKPRESEMTAATADDISIVVVATPNLNSRALSKTAADPGAKYDSYPAYNYHLFSVTKSKCADEASDLEGKCSKSKVSKSKTSKGSKININSESITSKSSKVFSKGKASKSWNEILMTKMPTPASSATVTDGSATPIPSTTPSQKPIPTSTDELATAQPSKSLSKNPTQLPTNETTNFTGVLTVTALFETDCETSCSPLVAFHGDTAVVTRSRRVSTFGYDRDIQFFSTTNGGFDLVTKIDFDYEPRALAIYGDTAVMGSYSFRDDGTGAIYIYEKDHGGNWSQTLRIRPSNITQGAHYGHSVAIDEDVIVVGAYDDGMYDHGSAYVYRRDGNTWTEEAKLSRDEYSARYFGRSVSVKGDTIVVGDDEYLVQGRNKGAAFIYEFDSLAKSWNEVSYIIGECNSRGKFGATARLTHDEELLVGCSCGRRVRYYEKQEMGDGYSFQQNIGFIDYVEGIAVDGNVMVVSEGWTDYTIHFFVRTNHVWEEVNQIDESTFEIPFRSPVALFGNAALITSGTNVYAVEDYFLPSS